MENNKTEIENLQPNLVRCRGRILFDPPHETKKHEQQGKWKRVAMVVFEDDLCAYYYWFLRKRFRLKLNKPQRGSHVTFLSDSIAYISLIHSSYTPREIAILLKPLKDLTEEEAVPIRDSIIEKSVEKGGLSYSQIDDLWASVKKKWDGKEIDVILNLHPATNLKHWWMVVDFDHREELQAVRSELKLGKPFFGLHMTLGTTHEPTKPHAEYISRIADDLIFISQEKDADENPDT